MKIKRIYVDLPFLIFFSIFIVLFPWESVRNVDFVDLQRYVSKYQDLKYLYISIDFSKVTSEPLWKYLNLRSANLGFEANAFFLCIAFFCILSLTLFVYIETKSIWFCVLFANPVTIDFVLSQQRSCLAFSIIILAGYIKGYTRFLVFAPSFLIHTVSFVIAFISELSLLISKRYLNSRLKLALSSLLIGFILAYATVYGREILLGYFGDRRAYEYNAASNSLIFSFPWLLYALFTMVKSREIRYSVTALVYMTIFFWCSVFDFYGNRFLAIGLPFLYIAMFHLPKNKVMVTALGSHQLLLLYFWL